MRRHTACFALSAALLLLGLLLLALGTAPRLAGHRARCHRPKHLLLAAQLLAGGAAGLAAYRPRAPCRPAAVALLVVFSALGTVLVLMDDAALDCLWEPAEESAEGYFSLSSFLAMAEVLGMQIAHILCAICVALACPDLWSKSKSIKKSEKLLKNSFKQKSKQALHLPEARTHIQEAAGTGEKVTVVSLPETDGIIYAVPEEQYVIRRGEATYMAPVGNSSLTAFFPTYRSQMD